MEHSRDVGKKSMDHSFGMVARLAALVLVILHHAAFADDSFIGGKKSKFFQLLGKDGGNIYQRPFAGSANILDRFSGNGEGSSTDSSTGSTILNKLRGHGEGKKFEASFDVLVHRHEGESANKSGKGKKYNSEKTSSSKREKSEKKEKHRQSSSKKSMNSSKKGKMKRKYSEGQRRAPTNSPIRLPSQTPARAFPTIFPSNVPSRIALRDGTQAPTIDSMNIQAPSAGPSLPTGGNSTVSPTATPFVSAPNSTSSTVIGIPRFFISAVSSDATVSPTDDEFELIFNATEEYFNQVLFEEFRNDNDTEFVRLEMELNNTRFELGVPEPRYNLYLDFSAASIFSASAPTLPTAQELFETLRVAINVTFITDILRAATGTPFADATEAFFASSSGII